MSDSTDVELAAGGDYQAFERLYKRYIIRVYALCARLSGSRTQGELLTRNVFVKAWEKLPEFSGETAFGAWLLRLAVDVVLDARQVDGLPVGAEQEGSPTKDRTDFASAPNNGERLDLSQAIDALPEGPRTIFVLHDVERYRHEEIAEIFGITVGMSKAQLRGARLLVRETLAR